MIKQHQLTIVRTLVTIGLLAIASSRVEARLTYEFVETPTGDVLATLELLSLPATHVDVVSLRLSPAGRTVFGFAPSYTPEIFNGTREFMDDGNNGLAGRATLVDANPPLSIFHENDGTDLFGVSAMLEADADTIVALPYNRALAENIVRSGNWVLVPEPSGILASVVAAILLAFSRRPV